MFSTVTLCYLPQHTENGEGHGVVALADAQLDHLLGQIRPIGVSVLLILYHQGNQVYQDRA
jgi:hypothetical protein